MLSRRKFLQAGAVVGGSLPLCACEPIISQLSQRLGLGIPDKLFAVAAESIDQDFHLLNRAGYGPWPGDLERLTKIGRQAWIDEQLDPAKIDDTISDIRSRRFETLLLPPGECYEFKKEVLRRDLTRYTFLKGLYSKRQLYETMVGFWSDHLNISMEKGDCIYLKAFDDQKIIRQHALGNFAKLIRQSATSPAMLIYLDGADNKKRNRGDAPNENYARELLELHTLGLNGGYTQSDILNTAACLSGWSVHKTGNRGTSYFDLSLHDQGEKIVLGKKIAACGGEKDLDQVVEIVSNHPSTAQFIARKLCVRYIGDSPAADIVNKAAAEFRRSGGEIRPVLRTILLSEQFAASTGAKVKRPFHFMLSCLRALAADTHAHDELVDYLLRMGQGPFQYPTPDGYPDEAAPWLGTLLWRWNFSFALCAKQLPEVEVDLIKLASGLGIVSSKNIDGGLLFAYFVGRQPNEDEKRALDQFLLANSMDNPENQAGFIGLILSSPAFQRC